MSWTQEQREAASKRMKELHARRKAENAETPPGSRPAPQLDPVPVRPRVKADASPAIIPEWRQAKRMMMTTRHWTMLRPQCHNCQDQDNVPLDWYRRCEHDPYVTMTPVREPSRYEEIIENGQPTGRFTVVAGRIVTFRPTPNKVEIADSPRVNSGHGGEWARRKGFILPSEVRSPMYPNGVADACMYRDCQVQTGLKRYKTGMFCRELESQYVWYDDNGKVLEVGEWSNESRQNLTNMLARADT